MEKNNDIVVEIENLNKEYKMYKRKSDRVVETLFPFIKNRHGKFKAMNNLNLELRKGEVLGILGKNGAGKSTLLKMITGVVTPTSGTIKVNGKISSLLELGAAFNAELTGYENIYQHGQVMGLTNAQIKAKEQEIIEFADIGEHLYQPVKTYSSGMFARLAFACAINVDPDILIVDEVLSVGDMAFQLKCFKKFEQFKKNNKTIIFVTHNIGDVLKNCNRAIILKEGTKVYDGDVKEGVEQYKKLISGIDKKSKTQEVKKDKQEKEDENKEKLWKNSLNENPNLIEYGTGVADIVDYGIFDEKGNLTSTIENDRRIVFKSRVKFNEKVKDPIFTLTIKDFHGIEIAGTNSMFEKVATGDFNAGDEAVAEFEQILNLAPGKYTVSFSCTHFKASGDLEVLSRKYDALLVEVLSNKDCVGYVRLDSKINIYKY